jgi:hypothetical protein
VITWANLTVFPINKFSKVTLLLFVFLWFLQKKCKHVIHVLGIINAKICSVFLCTCWFVCLMVFNATFNNISVISWRSVLLVEEIIDTDKLYHIMLYTSPWSRFELTTSVVIGTDCTYICKSSYHTISATTATYVPVGKLFLLQQLKRKKKKLKWISIFRNDDTTAAYTAEPKTTTNV